MNGNSVNLAQQTFPEDRLPSRSDAALVGSKVLPPQAQQLFLLLFSGPVCFIELVLREILLISYQIYLVSCFLIDLDKNISRQ